MKENKNEFKVKNNCDVIVVVVLRIGKLKSTVYGTRHENQF